MSFKAASQIQNDVIKRIGGEKFLPFICLYQSWRDVVGDLIASRSHPFKFYNSILYIAVQNNAWLQELYLNKAEILRKCRAKTSAEIKDIIFLIRNR